MPPVRLHPRRHRLEPLRMSKKLLVYSKDRSIGELLGDGLEKRDFVLSATNSKKKMLTLASSARADFLLVDGSHSLEAGLEFCRQLRQRNDNARILLVTPSRKKINSKFIDASFCAPITLRKLLYRLRKLLEPDPRRLITIGPITLDVENRYVRSQNQGSRLTPKETLLLELLMQQVGSLVSRKEIMNRVWKTDYMGDTRTIDVHIRWLRKKIEPSPNHPRYILTERGKGYRFEITAPAPMPAEESPISAPAEG